MRYRIGCLLMFMAMFACDPLEVGGPPVFDPGGFSAKRVTGSQIELSWELATDDFLAPEEIKYAIWFAEVENGAADLALDEAPQHLTGDGAFSFNLIGLEENTAYEILVRARERGTPVYSVNETPRTVAAGGASPDTFENETEIVLDNRPTRLFGGKFTSPDRASLGVVSGDEIDFYIQNGNSNTFDKSTFSIGANIVDAQLEDADYNTGEDELFVLTEQALLVYPDAAGTPIRLDAANAGSLGFAESGEQQDEMGEDTRLRLISIRVGSEARIYSVDFSANPNAFVLEGTHSLGDSSAFFRLADLNADGSFDIVSFGTQGLKVFLGTDEFDFNTEQELNDDISAGFVWSFFLTEGDDSNLFNVYIFLRNSGADDTGLWVYRGLSDGTFSEKTEIDYGTSFYSAPVFADYDGNGTTDLIIPKTSSNNVAIYNRAFGFQTISN